MTDIQIKIKTTYTSDINVVTIKTDSKVEDIMKEIEKYSGIPPSGQKLIYKGKILKPEEPIQTYKIENDSVLIMVKTATAQTNPQSSSSQQQAPSNNVSSNPEENITIKVKTNLDATVHEITINKNATVLGLKGEIEKKTQIPPGQQKLIVKGRTMKDSDPISNYELNNESTVAMIKVDNVGHGLPPGLGGLNPRQQGGEPPLDAILNNPQMLDQILNSPQLQALFQNNPDLRNLLQNPIGRQLFIRELMSQGGANPLSGLGGLGGLSGLRPSSSPNTRLGELFTQWMDAEKSGQPHAPPQQPRVPVGGLGGPHMNPQPVYQQFPQPDPNVDYKEKYKDQIAQIKEMGIDDEEKIIEALKKCDGNVTYALNRLFS